MINFNFIIWEKKYRAYLTQGIDCLIAWHMANKYYEMDGDGWKKFEKEINNLLENPTIRNLENPENIENRA